MLCLICEFQKTGFSVGGRPLAHLIAAHLLAICVIIISGIFSHGIHQELVLYILLWWVYLNKSIFNPFAQSSHFCLIFSSVKSIHCDIFKRLCLCCDLLILMCYAQLQFLILLQTIFIYRFDIRYLWHFFSIFFLLAGESWLGMQDWCTWCGLVRSSCVVTMFQQRGCFWSWLSRKYLVLKMWNWNCDMKTILWSVLRSLLTWDVDDEVFEFISLFVYICCQSLIQWNFIVVLLVAGFGLLSCLPILKVVFVLQRTGIEALRYFIE